MRHLIAASLLLAPAGCGDDDCCTMSHHDAMVDVLLGQDANTSLTEVALVPSTVNRDLDLLFVIDDSTAMFDKQKRLVDAFPRLLSTLARAPGGLPNLHIGVVTSDLGAKGAYESEPGPGIASSCLGFGKDGALQTNGAPVSDLFLRNVEGANGDRVSNYTGELASVFAQMASVGATGCPFEQSLEAIHRAIENPTNVGFMRPSARLAIVLLSDEDDCSMGQTVLMTSDTTALGPLSSFRCTRFGVTCDVGGPDSDQMYVPGTKSACRSNEQSSLLTDVARYVNLLYRVKSDPRDVLFTAIVAPEAPFNVVEATSPVSGMTASALQPSCTYAGPTQSDFGIPAVRTTQLARSLHQGHLMNICDADFPARVVELGQRVNGLLGGSCVQRMINMPAVCEAFDIDRAGGFQHVPACATTSSTPCIRVVPNPVACPAGQQLEVEIVRTVPVGADTWTSVRCAV